MFKSLKIKILILKFYYREFIQKEERGTKILLRIKILKALLLNNGFRKNDDK
jgi:hypothetical protein